MEGRRVFARRPRFAEDSTLGRLLLIILLALLLVAAGGAVFLFLWDIPAPTKQVETIIPDERLPR